MPSAAKNAFRTFYRLSFFLKDAAISSIQHLHNELRIQLRAPASGTTEIFREMVREVVMFPLPVKFSIAFGISIIFVVITQWERLGLATQWEHLTVKQQSIVATSTLSNSPPHSEQRSPDASPPLPIVARAEETEASRLEHMGRITITDPQAQFNGSIIGNGQTFYLYGIKHFDSKQVCIWKSGARWACGLRAYAALRNATAKRTLVCDPKMILRNALSAVCHVGATDVALALVRNGLVELDDDVEDTKMLEAQAIAKRQKLGVWDRQN